VPDSSYRAVRTGSVTLAAGATLAPAIDVKAYGYGLLQIPATWDGGGLMYFRGKFGASWIDIYEKDGTRAVVSSVAADQAMEIPAVVMQAEEIKPLVLTANTPSTAGALGLAFVLKS